MNERNNHGAERITDHPRLGADQRDAWVVISIDGEDVVALTGETVFTALLASGRRVCRTMPLEGEARGGYCLSGRCADCLMIIDGQPNVQACVTTVKVGMTVRTQSGFGEWTGSPQ